jgi:hypothetical protein
MDELTSAESFHSSKKELGWLHCRGLSHVTAHS